jgi:RluA family pseudouridine synthase
LEGQVFRDDIFWRVRPYPHTYSTHSKTRWLKKRLIDVLTHEFKAYDESYYRAAILDGRLTINNKKVSPEYQFGHGDLL